MAVRVLQHPLAEHLLAGLRDRETPPEKFRIHAKHLTTLLVLEATRAIPTASARIETPLEPMDVNMLGMGLAVVPILRAGLGMLEPILELYPDVKVGYIGLKRNEETAVADSYYSNLPSFDSRFTLCVDPMLATGGSAAQAVHLIKASGGTKIVMVSVVSTPEGINHFENEHPDVEIVTGAVDRGLNPRKFIVPGLGDFGDRLFGTL